MYFLIVVIIANLFLSACMVGPDFHSPAAPSTHRYTATSLPAKTAGISGAGGHPQYFVSADNIPLEWWALFHSRDLNTLIKAGLLNNPTLTSAEAALRQAQETVTAQIGASLYPAVAGQLSGERQRFSGASVGAPGTPSSVFNLINAAVSVTYVLDIFGGARREIESLQAQVDYQRYQWEAAYLTLTANIATTTITIASLQAQVFATQDLVRSQEKQLRIVKRQFDVGGVSGGDVYAQESQLAQTRATLPPLEQSLSQSKHALAVLVGVLPSEAHTPTFNLDHFHLPAHLPVTLPSALARQRPDVRAAEALLHAASAQVGVATANLYPQLTLSGGYGWNNTTVANLFSPNNALWNFGAALAQPIYNGGSLQAKRRAAVAGFEQAAAQYQQTVLVAFQNVADSLRAVEHDASAFKAQKQAEIAARESLRLVADQFALGGVNYLSLLNAQRQYQQARINRIQAQANRFTDTAALFQALGGGWWNRTETQG